MTPTLSIVTPSYNQARFLPRAIESVLAQEPSPLEYWVMDGGSTDGSVEVLRSYGERLQSVSEPDRGQSHAINKGFARCTGDVIAWLNSDDTYLDGAFDAALRIFADRPDVVLVYGRGEILDAEDRPVGPFHGLEPFQLWRLLHGLDYILQPATFFRRSAFVELGGLDEDLHYAMDWDLWIRLASIGEVAFLDRPLACSREYADTKTSTGGLRRLRELGRLARRNTGTFWTPGIQLYGLDTAERWLRARAPRLEKRLAPLFRRRMAAIQEGMPVHADGWFGPRGALTVPRRWRRAEVEVEAMTVPSSGGFEVRFEFASRDIGRLAIHSPGRYLCTFDIPPGQGPFCDIRVESGHAFRPDPATGDRRVLSVLCRAVRPA